MWDNVIIGNGDKGCTTIICSDIEGDHGISENRVSYWITDCIMGIDCTVFKDTKEGQKISKMREEKKGVKVIQNYIDSLVLKRIDVVVFKNLLKNEQDKYFRKGEESKQEEVKEVLGVHDIMGVLYAS